MKAWLFLASLLLMIICVLGETAFSYTLKWLGHYVDAEKAVNSTKVVIAISVTLFGTLVVLFAMTYAVEFFLIAFGLEPKALAVYFFIARVFLILLSLFLAYQFVHLLVLKGIPSLGIPAMNLAFSYVFWFVAGLTIAATLSYLTPSWGETFCREKLFLLAACVMICGRLAWIDYHQKPDKVKSKTDKTLIGKEDPDERFWFMKVPRLNRPTEQD